MKAGDVVASRFELTSFVGEGGMGDVYRATDRQSGEVVALKHVRASREGDQRFFREARALALLSHPAVVRYVAHGGVAGGDHYLAMEWLEGETLRDRLERGPLPLDETVDLARRVAGALAHAHSQGVVHCDLSPSNLLLIHGSAGAVKVLDFGLARHRGDRTETTLRWEGPTGTLGYMAPEQARGTGDVDARADLFALGAVLFECVTGKPVFGSESYLAVLAKIVVASAPRLRDVTPEAPPPLDELVSALLSKDPEDRPASADAVLETLSTVGGSRPTLRAPVHADSVAITERERELVSVVLARGGGSFAELAARAELRSERLADGSAVLTTAGTGVATDQAARAASAALELAAAHPGVAIGVATGWATVAGGLPQGDVVERAACLSARPGVVAIDDVTRGLLPPRFDVAGERGAFTLNDTAPKEKPVRLLLGRETPCVGRDRELRTLHAVLDESVSAPLSQVVLMTGAAGAGKSRIRYELVNQLVERHPELEVWIGRGDPMRAGAPLAILAEALRSALGIVASEPREVGRERLVSAVARTAPATDRARVAEFLGELLGLGFPESVALAAARNDPLLMSDQVRRAFEDFVSLECRARPLLLILEDLQWGDGATVKLLDAALRNLPELPWTVLAIARPDIHETFPGLWLERNVQELRIGALTRRAAESLIRETLGDVDEATLVELTQRAAGNAFYLEELIRAKAEGRRDALPDTVLGMVKERIEGMEPEARRVLRAASVFGQSFTAGGVVALVGGDAMAAEIGEWLDTLEQREVITRRSEGYTFRHALVRDAAYAMLTDHDRALGHGLAAEHLERSGTIDATLMAQHFERAGAPERAARFWRVAASSALDAGDFDAAITRAERGLGSGVIGAESAELELCLGEALRLSGRVAESLPAVERALAGFPRGSLGWCNAMGERCIILQRLGQSVALLESASDLAGASADEDAVDALALARVRAALALLRMGERARARELVDRADQPSRLVGPVTSAHVHAFRAGEALLDGHPGRSLAEARIAQRRHAEVGDVRLALEQSISIGSVQMELGAHRDAEVTLREALAQAERLGLWRSIAGAQHNLGLVLAYLGRYDEAIFLQQRARESFRDRDQRLAGGAELALGMIFLLAGDFSRASEHAARALEELATAAPPLVPAALATLSRICLAKGEAQQALELADRADAALHAEGGVEFGEHAIRRARAEALHANGGHEAAREVVREAIARLREEAEKLDDPVLARCFLEQVPDNLRLLALGKEWGLA